MSQADEDDALIDEDGHLIVSNMDMFISEEEQMRDQISKMKRADLEEKCFQLKMALADTKDCLEACTRQRNALRNELQKRDRDVFSWRRADELMESMTVAKASIVEDLFEDDVERFIDDRAESEAKDQSDHDILPDEVDQREDIPDPVVAEEPPAVPAPMASGMPRLSPLGGTSEKIIYTLSVSKKRVLFAYPYKMDPMDVTRDKISLETTEKGRIYQVAGLRGDFVGAVSEPSAESLQQYLERNAFVCESEEAYRRLIVPTLLLGCRVRDYENRRCTVEKIDELVLTMSMLPQNKRIEKLDLKTDNGATFDVEVWNVQKERGKWRIICKQPSRPLPPDVVMDCGLEITNLPIQSPVPQALYRFTEKEGSSIDNWPLLACIYGEPEHRVQRRVSNFDFSCLRHFPLNQEQKEAVALYNCASCPGFVIEAPPGSGKTVTAAAMAVSYKGKGVQLLLSTANWPVLNMAQAVAKLGCGDLHPIHLISSEFEDKLTEEAHSPFSPLTLAKKSSELKKRKIEQLVETMKYAPIEEKKKLKDEIYEMCEEVQKEPYDAYFATVDTILKRLLKQTLDETGQDDIVKHLLMTKVERVIIDEASQVTEAALNAIVLSFPKAQIVLIGDSKQLPPFKFKKGGVVSALAIRPALNVFQDKKNLPVIRLVNVYRAPQPQIAHYNTAFYSGTLKSNLPKLSWNPLSCFENRGVRRPCLFWRMMSGQFVREGCSKTNDKEISSLIHIVGQLRWWQIQPKDIMIISYYEAQRKKAVESDWFPGIEILTVDSAQGREKKVVIVLTTRTAPSGEPDGGFLNAPERCNVAVSRHQEALIVIGHTYLETIPLWRGVLKNFDRVDDNVPPRGTYGWN